MMAVSNSQRFDDGHLKQSKFKYTTEARLWKYCEYKTFLVTEIVSSQGIIYIIKHKYTQPKSIIVVVISYISLFCVVK